MDSSNSLMAVKVVILIGAGVVFVWWQLRDLAQEKRRSAEREAKAESSKR
jgi:hypothetical protein